MKDGTGYIIYDPQNKANTEFKISNSVILYQTKLFLINELVKYRNDSVALNNYNN